MYKWYLPTLSEILALSTSPVSAPNSANPNSVNRFPAQQQVRAEREWSGAIAALNELLQLQAASGSAALGKEVSGVVLSGPVAVLDQCLVHQFAAWTLTVSSPQERLKLPAAENLPIDSAYATPPTLPLMASDPLAAEQFCLVLTPTLSLVMAVGETPAGTPTFLFSFEPETVWQAWRSIQARLKLAFAPALSNLESLVEQFAPVAPDYRTVIQFTRLMLTHLPDPADLEADDRKRVESIAAPSVKPPAYKTVQPIKVSVPPKHHGKKSKYPGERVFTVEPILSHGAETVVNQGNACPDTELLQAIAHEVRTPLTTIRTLTRLLLKRKELSPDVIKRLQTIDRECTEQIDRFNLIFRAAELETTQTRAPLSPLSPISLAQVLQQNIDRWQQQATQHSHTLEVSLPQKLPMVITDPTMLDQALTGLVDRITHSLPPGSHIHVCVTLAGHQLKLQFESYPEGKSKDGKEEGMKFGVVPTLKSIGQLLMFQPETGNLSLNMSVTKNLFQVLGGKLIVKHHPQQGEILTVFLPLETR